VSGSEVEGAASKTFLRITTLSTDLAHLPDYLLGCFENTIVNSASVLGQTDEDRVVVYVQCGGACTLTQGYWKTHSAVGPAGYHDDFLAGAGDWKHRDDTWDDITVWDWDGAIWSLIPGNEFSTFFLSGEAYWEVQWKVNQGDKYYNLAHQYIAAQLNIQVAINEGSSFGALPQEVQDAYNDATDFFKTYDPATGKLKGKDAKDLIEWASILANFNEGTYSGWPHCDDTPEGAQVQYGLIAVLAFLGGGGLWYRGKHREE